MGVVKKSSVVVPSGHENISRQQALLWINEMLQAEFSSIEQLHVGDAYCLLNSVLFPGSIQLRNVKWNTQNDAEKRENWKLLQSDWDKRGINKPVPVDRLIKGKFQDNFEFLQWVKRLFDINFDGHACSPVKMRDGVELPSRDKFKANRQRFPSMQLRRESLAPATFVNRPSVGFSGVHRPSVAICGTPAPRQSLGFVPNSSSANRGAVMQVSFEGKSASSQPPYRTPQKQGSLFAPPSFNASLNQLAKEMDKVKEERDHYVGLCYAIEQYCRENVGRVGVAATVLEILRGSTGALSSSKGSLATTDQPRMGV